MRKRVGVMIAVQVLFATSLCLAQGSESNQKLAEQAQQEYVVGKFADAERDFRELTKRDPSDIRATTYLGHSLFRQEKYADAVAPTNRSVGDGLRHQWPAEASASSLTRSDQKRS